ncbi:signal peptidase I [Helcococcus kunzii]|uniref:Signal peptidase I n=1 Tax=Helcococcus kunzii ATCC 51366 TaxID=883114 RepID=H3NPL9_9FIRM|nr:signal peptidase I [Helcococcus kunzii]EHR33247.1 signal peptidase I [Helcococcus kunzii ATCC 51366]
MRNENRLDEKLDDNKIDKELNENEIKKEENLNEDPEKRSKGSAILEWAKSILIAVVLALLIKNFIVEPTRIQGSSMNMTLQNDDRVIVNKIGMRFKPIERGNIIVMKYDNTHDYIKRVIGLPGEYIQVIDGKVYINGELYEESYIYGESTQSINGSEWKLGKNEFFVMGDNRTPGGSTDSRVFGPVKLDQIKGVAIYRFYPFNSMGVLK